ncbi:MULTISPECIES: STAS domain-containing protein [unclassified Lysobacter]
MTELSLQSDLGIEHVGALQQVLLPHLEDDEPVSIVADQVQRVHAAGLQLLHAFVRDRAGAGRRTSFTLASPALVNAARQLALAVSLGVENTQAVNGDIA